MKTDHTIYFTSSQNMQSIDDATVDLVVTSPPYPMIEMWDEILSQQNPTIADALLCNTALAFELMHQELDKVWRECYRVIKDGGLMCINIGDATRTINKEFQLYNNHARIVDACLKLGFVNLPNIIWRKQTNAPNKFMGSGMLPCGAYVTLEHEWILVFRKGGKRCYKEEADKATRRSSSFFWEERNKWFSDLWEIKGVKQKINNSPTRERNASYPLEIPYRLINMYSQQGDVVLDPFVGLGTTTIASLLTGRNSIGVDIDAALEPSIRENIGGLQIDALNGLIADRYNKHLDFVKEREAQGKEVKYENHHLKCKVMTSQEVDINLHYIDAITAAKHRPLSYECTYLVDVPISEYTSADRSSLFY
jgi:DNA modification methylase